MQEKTAVSYEGLFRGTKVGGMPFVHRVSGTICLDDPTSVAEITAQLNAVALILRRNEGSAEPPETLAFEGKVGETPYNLEWTVASLKSAEPGCPDTESEESA